jgi:Holliday junction resolvase RusA-like endonuclease
MIVDFIVPGIPIALPRERATVAYFRQGGQLKAYAKLYTPEDSDIADYKRAIASSVSVSYAGDVMVCPVSVIVDFIMPRPKSLIWVRKPMVRLPCRDVPDVDNLFKAVADALTGALWKDDRQIWECRLRKYYAAGDERPHTKVMVSTVDGEFDYLEEA